MATYRSPAKINLFLRILGKRPDGYHELASLFQAISLFDEISVTQSTQDHFSCSLSHLAMDERNLVCKALRLFREQTGLKMPVNIHLHKNIPMEAGLGGGSSNAATTLWALNELFGKPASLEQLKQWAGTLGSDVAFFLSEGTAYCTGRGEILQELSPLKAQTLWLVKPSEGLSTPAVYKQFNASETEPREPLAALDLWKNGRGECFNDLERPAFQLMPTLEALKKQMQQAGNRVLLSGSGTSLFCLGERSASTFEGCQVYTAHFTNRQPSVWY